MLLSFFVFFSQWVRISICCNWSSHGYANKLSDAKLAQTTKQRFHTFLVVFFHSLWWILIQYLFTLLNCLHLRRGPLMGVVRSTFRSLTELLPLWICWLTCRWNTLPHLCHKPFLLWDWQLWHNVTNPQRSAFIAQDQVPLKKRDLDLAQT